MENAFVLMRDASGEMFDGRDTTFPDNEKEFRGLWFSTELELALREFGEYEKECMLYVDNADVNRKIHSFASLATIERGHLVQLHESYRADIIKGFVGPFKNGSSSAEEIARTLLQVSRRQSSSSRDTSTKYTDNDFAVAISYKQRARTENTGGTLNEQDAAILGAGLSDILQSIGDRTLWVWFDQMLSQNVPNVDSSVWYRYGALPYLVLPVFKYVHVDMEGELFRPWLVFEDIASRYGAGFWSTKDGMMSSHESRTGRYERILNGRHIACPGKMIRWRAGLSFTVKSLFSKERDRLLESYEFADSFRHFLSWATHVMAGQRVLEEERLPSYYRMEVAFSALLDSFESPENVEEIEEWTVEHHELKDRMFAEASKILVRDAAGGDCLVPVASRDGMIGLRNHEGGVIIEKDGEFRVIEARRRDGCNMLPLVTKAVSLFFWNESVWPGTGRIFDASTGEMTVNVMRYQGSLMYVIGVLKEIITDPDEAGACLIEQCSIAPEARIFYDTFIAIQAMNDSVWHFPVFCRSEGTMFLLQVELFRHGILRMESGVIGLQADIIWTFCESDVQFLREAKLVHQVRFTSYFLSTVGESCDGEEVNFEANGCISDDDSHTSKLLLGIVEGDRLSVRCVVRNHSADASSLQDGGPVFVDELILHISGSDGVFVCGVNNRECSLRPANEGHDELFVIWGDLSEIPAHELPKATCFEHI